MTEENKNLTTTITDSDDLTQKSDAQEIATFAEKAKAAVVTVEKERDEYRRLYVAANGEVLGLKQEIRERIKQNSSPIGYFPRRGERQKTSFESSQPRRGEIY
ncbi:865_t:CDS:2 [Cetraspora pellucida]|uniref:865_t:CDS:1 n=1 Tax=Cetraspora pellucida TaxID=1433469 RepID=A0ACA9KNH4_9GLOM|nr:865_t:CDS:2 [Cetraspora pellucida]